MSEVRLSPRLLAALAPKMSPFERWLFGATDQKPQKPQKRVTVGASTERLDIDRRETRRLVIAAGLPLFRSYVDRAEELLTKASPKTALRILAGGSHGH